MLTKKQYELLLYIDRRLKETGVSPSFDEMKDALELKSKSGIHRLITGLEERGFIRRLPHKARAMNDMESMIHHFKQIMEGVAAPVGEAYLGVENPRGELGYYFVSDGTAKPVRWRIRPPAFINLAALPKMSEGHLLSDLIAINASVDIVMGEVDR